MIHLCAAEDCRQPFQPDHENEHTQKYCSARCGGRDRVRRHRARLKQKPTGGGGPGGKRQAMLFSRSELHRRKPNKAALVPKPKPGDLFPPDEGIVGRDLHVAFADAVDCGGSGAVSDNTGADYGKYSVKPATLPSQAKPEATLAA